MLERNAADAIHRIEDAYVNFYLVQDGDRLTVVDTGHPRSWNALQAALRELGRSPTDVEAVVLTHAHFDHMGFAERARTQLGVPVYAHVLEVPVTQHPWRYDHENSRAPYFAKHPGFVKAFTAMGAAGALWVKATKEVKTYGSEETLDVPGRPRVVFTPGHTHGHCALHFADRGAVITGDAIVTYDPYIATAGPQIISGAATADSAQALASLDALTATGADTLLTGHGPVWRHGAASAVEQARVAGPS